MKPSRPRWALAVLAALLWHALPAQATAQFKIVTASERGTYIEIGRDLASLVAPDAGVALEVLPSAGSAENLQRLRVEAGVKLALVQSDVYQAFMDRADAGDRAARALIRPLRVVMPLYNEEIYFVVRSDSPMKHVHEIRGARINIGPSRSGTALTAQTLYRQMFGGAMPENRITQLSNEAALVKLVTDKSLDVVVIVAGQPAKLLVDMTPEARQLIRLLPFDVDNPTSQAALNTYYPSTVKASNYPNLLQDDLPGLAVKAYLVTYDYTRPTTLLPLTRLARSLCENFGKLQTRGHPKWREVKLSQPPLARGWTYAPAMSRELKSCIDEHARAPQAAAQQPADASALAPSGPAAQLPTARPQPVVTR